MSNPQPTVVGYDKQDLQRSPLHSSETAPVDFAPVDSAPTVSQEDVSIKNVEGQSSSSPIPPYKETSDSSSLLPNTSADAALDTNQSNNFCEKETIKILITGKSGTSKSVLINGLAGSEVIRERHGVLMTNRASNLMHYTDKEGSFEVWSSSHLQDDEQEFTGYGQELKDKCSDVHLIIYCLKMTETRFLPDNPDIQAMRRLTQILGEEIWSTKTVFALTHANLAAELISARVGKESEDAKEKAFIEWVDSWRDIIKDVLSNDVKVKLPDKGIQVVPAGHYSMLDLPGQDCWLLNFFVECCSVMKEKTLEKFLKLNEIRLKGSQMIESKNEDTPIHKRPLPIQKWWEWIKNKSQVLATALSPFLKD